jgi:hypothetical protein
MMANPNFLTPDEEQQSLEIAKRIYRLFDGVNYRVAITVCGAVLGRLLAEAYKDDGELAMVVRKIARNMIRVARYSHQAFK